MRSSKGEKLEDIPSVGRSVAADLRRLGIHEPEDLNGKDPQALYDHLCALEGKHMDRCLLYTFRCAVYYVSHPRHDPRLLKWWNWKDK